MKRIGVKTRREQGLKRRLELVRSTVRVLTPTQLEGAKGGNEETGCIPGWTRITDDCHADPTPAGQDP
jgi:hypothetical protein